MTEKIRGRLTGTAAERRMPGVRTLAAVTLVASVGACAQRHTRSRRSLADAGADLKAEDVPASRDGADNDCDGETDSALDAAPAADIVCPEAWCGTTCCALIHFDDAREAGPPPRLYCCKGRDEPGRVSLCMTQDAWNADVCGEFTL